MTDSTLPSQANITPHNGRIDRSDREKLLGQRGVLVWLTGLSGSGKSTIARALEERLAREKRLTYVLDGDNIRAGLNSDLGFGEEDRRENVRRIAEVAALFVDAGLITITAFISPHREERQLAREKVGEKRFLEVFIDTPIEVCEARDPKGLYRRARSGEIPQFTGVSSPYEPPENPALTIDTVADTVECAAGRILTLLSKHGFISTTPEHSTP
ncbi:MAG TPA: adenylyl-sulfate kinase [Thermoanaerobaculia bacterium]|nr:adenylyl-sulfate kinase [Thermoanaerobaculia bacterium]